MMKKLLILSLGLVLSAGAFGDSLEVNGDAAIEGNFGMAVEHDNSSTAFVESSSPDNETVYRGSFLFDPNNVNASATRNFRQLIMSTKGPNPNPGVGNCSTLQNIDPIRIWYFPTGGVGQNSNIQIFAFGNQCGPRGSTRIGIPNAGASRICWEVSMANGNEGRVDLAVVDAGSACPSSGDSAWDGADITNGNTSITSVRLGVPATNNFDAGENGTMYFDSFESFRTLSP